MQFLATRMTSPDPVRLRRPDVHPFGRYCNANKLAGEVDTLEALEHALSEYPIDPQRVAIRGFSMGGCSCLASGGSLSGPSGSPRIPGRVFRDAGLF